MKRSAWLAVAWIAGIVLLSLALPFLMPERAGSMDFTKVLLSPSFEHPFGTDALGRDIFARIWSGGRVSLGVGFAAVLIAVSIGLILGAVSGYAGGWVDRVLMGFVDIMLCFPTFFLILAVIAVLGPGILNIFIIIGLTSWMGTARLVRAEVLSLREREFVLASRAMGAKDSWIIFRHMIPNALGPVIVNAVLGISSAILAETGLSFLGIGVQPPAPSWGNILSDGKAVMGIAWWITLFPGLMIFFTVLSANVLGESLGGKARGGER